MIFTVKCELCGESYTTGVQNYALNWNRGHACPDSGRDRPQNYDEIEAFLDICWEAKPTDTAHMIHKRWEARREEMRS